MNAPESRPVAELVPLSLKDAPALIETVFPAQKVSFEAQTERKAVAAQTLTGLGSYWKGRKPLILVRAILLGSLLPLTENQELDLTVFEKLMAFDDEGLSRRALAANAFSMNRLMEMIPIDDPERFFGGRGWRRDITDDEKLELYRRAIATLGCYEEKAAVCKRPEEVDQEWLYAPVWSVVNKHYGHLGIKAHSFPELIEQLGVLRFGHRPRVGDTFSGGGSIPFEAARIGCDAFASDLNPVACMLTWGALNVIGANPAQRSNYESEQRKVFAAVDKELVDLGIEHDGKGNRAKAYLYCLETRCPETGWMIPLAPSWVISPKQGVIAKLVPNAEELRFDLEIVTGVTGKALSEAEKGTIRDGNVVYELNGRTYRTPIKTLRGDYRTPDGVSGNRLRRWEKGDFCPRSSDVLQERLYAIQWITKDSLDSSRQDTYFAGPNRDDLAREQLVERIVAENIGRWQEEGLIPDMAIEAGDETSRLFRERGWTHWHHLYNARQILQLSLIVKHWRASSAQPLGWLNIAKAADFNSRLCRWATAQGGGLGGPKGVFSNQALNTFFNYATRAWPGFGSSSFRMAEAALPEVARTIISATADKPQYNCDYWITDPPYADAVNYHEITEFFIAWLRKNPPIEFSDWIWDSRRALAIKGSGEDFRRGMVEAYKGMADHMPDNGMQCVMFTHQDTGVWSDMVGIFWAAGLQVVAAWYIATETSTELKKGGYVQGTVTLMLRKRDEGDRTGFKQRILPAVRAEVRRQIEQMLHLNGEAKSLMGEPVFNDADLQMAGYAAALKVLTGYTKIGDTDVTTLALRPRAKGEVTVVDEIVQEASEAANSLLVPEGLNQDTWQAIGGVQRFYLRMLDMESVGVSKLDNYQNFAKAFRVKDYTRIMSSMAANNACMKQPNDFSSRDLTDSTEIGPTWLGALIVAIQQILKDVELKVVVQQLMVDIPEFLEIRPKLIDITRFLASKARDAEVRNAAEVLADRMLNQRALGQD